MEAWLLMFAVLFIGFVATFKDKLAASEIHADGAKSRLDSVDDDCVGFYEKPMETTYSKAETQYEFTRDEANELLVAIACNLNILCNSKYFEEDKESYMPLLYPEVFSSLSPAELQQEIEKHAPDFIDNYLSGKYNLKGLEQEIRLKKVVWFNKRISKDKTLINKIILNAKYDDRHAFINEIQNDVEQRTSEQLGHYHVFLKYGGDEVDWFSEYL